MCPSCATWAGAARPHHGRQGALPLCIPIEPCNWTLFISWSKTKTKIYHVDFNDDYFTILWDAMIDFMAGDVPYDTWKVKQALLKDAGNELARAAELIGVYDSCELGKTEE